jgi:hypothetical protein
MFMPVVPMMTGIHPSEPFAFNGEIDRSRPKQVLPVGSG